MKKYLKNWNFMRVLKLVLGIIVIVQGVQFSEWLMVGFGALFALMSMLNIACCGTSACNTTACKK